MKTSTAENNTDSFMQVKQKESLTQTSDKPYTEATIALNSAGQSVAIDAPDVLGGEITGTSQDGSITNLKTPSKLN